MQTRISERSASKARLAGHPRPRKHHRAIRRVGERGRIGSRTAGFFSQSDLAAGEQGADLESVCRLAGAPCPSHERRCRAPGRLLAERRVADRGSRPSEVFLRQSPRVDVEARPCQAGQEPLVGRALLQRTEGRTLDHFEGRSWRGWHHHVTLTLPAYAFLVELRRKKRIPG